MLVLNQGGNPRITMLETKRKIPGFPPFKSKGNSRTSIYETKGGFLALIKRKIPGFPHLKPRGEFYDFYGNTHLTPTQIFYTIKAYKGLLHLGKQ